MPSQSRDQQERKSLVITQRLALKGKKVEELRELAGRHLDIDPSEMSAQELREKLSRAAEYKPSLSKELGKSPISLKPSFYLMMAKVEANASAMSIEANKYASIFFDNVNNRLSEASVPSLREFQIMDVSQPSPGILEIQVIWHQIMHYLSTAANFEHVYTLKPGFVFVDALNGKALICCHTLGERDVIAEALEQRLRIKFTPITLTKELLENVGSFEKVKKVGYLVTDPGPNETEEVSYGDDKLANKPDVVAKESNPKFFRKRSFYRIDLGGLAETGVGVTSDTAKLWIASDTPIESVREYGLLLLKRFTTTLKKMKEMGDIPGILRVLAVQRSLSMAKIPGKDLRLEVADLAHELVQMLLSNQKERPYTPPAAFLTRAIPDLFNPARLQVQDESTEDVKFWTDSDGESQLLRFALENGKWSVRTFDGSQKLNLNSLRHPLTGNSVEITDPLRAVELRPTRRLHEILLNVISQVSSQFPKLEKVVALPFYIHSGRLVLSIDNATDKDFACALKGEIDINAVRQFTTALQQTISSSASRRLEKQLVKLGEKCAHMTDANCEHCLEHRKFLCLRSLLARFMSQTVLLMHKGIELSDLQGTLLAEGEKRRVWVFSKLAKGKSGLTLRNHNGAILLAQIVAQLDKNTFDCIGILTPSTVNEDLRDRLGFLGGLVGKRILVVNRPALEKMLAHFEEQTIFEKSNPKKVYSSSRSKKAKGRDLQAAGSFV